MVYLTSDAGPEKVFTSLLKRCSGQYTGFFTADTVSANGFDYAAGTGDLIGFDLMLGGTRVAGVTVDVDAVGDGAAPGPVTNALIADEISKNFNFGVVLTDGESAVLEDGSGHQVTVTRVGNDFDFAASGGLPFTIENFTDDDASGAGVPVALAITASPGTILASTRFTRNSASNSLALPA